MAQHIVAPKTYIFVFLSLIAGTILTTLVAFVDLGMFSTPVALAIAVTKALLVILFFMHVKYSVRLTWVFVAAGFFWLGIMFTLGFSDYLSRSIVPFAGK